MHETDVQLASSVGLAICRVTCLPHGLCEWLAERRCRLASTSLLVLLVVAARVDRPDRHALSHGRVISGTLPETTRVFDDGPIELEFKGRPRWGGIKRPPRNSASRSLFPAHLAIISLDTEPGPVSA